MCIFANILKDMNAQMKLIRTALVQFINDIDTSNSNITGDAADKLIDYINELLKDTRGYHAYACYTYLGIGHSTWKKLIEKGDISHGFRSAGSKENTWSKEEIEEYSIKSGKKNKKGFTLEELERYTVRDLSKLKN